jgi:hypothetical protein
MRSLNLGSFGELKNSYMENINYDLEIEKQHEPAVVLEDPREPDPEIEEDPEDFDRADNEKKII